MTDLLGKVIETGDYVACVYRDCGWIIYGYVISIKKTEKVETITVQIIKDGSGYNAHWYSSKDHTIQFKWFDDPSMNKYKKIIVIPNKHE